MPLNKKHIIKTSEPLSTPTKGNSPAKAPGI